MNNIQKFGCYWSLGTFPLWIISWWDKLHHTYHLMFSSTFLHCVAHMKRCLEWWWSAILTWYKIVVFLTVFGGLSFSSCKWRFENVCWLWSRRLFVLTCLLAVWMHCLQLLCCQCDSFLFSLLIFCWNIQTPSLLQTFLLTSSFLGDEQSWIWCIAPQRWLLHSTYSWWADPWVGL